MFENMAIFKRENGERGNIIFPLLKIFKGGIWDIRPFKDL
jgi:hypothetical protein